MKAANKYKPCNILERKKNSGILGKEIFHTKKLSLLIQSPCSIWHRLILNFRSRIKLHITVDRPCKGNSLARCSIKRIGVSIAYLWLNIINQIITSVRLYICCRVENLSFRRVKNIKCKHHSNIIGMQHST